MFSGALTHTHAFTKKDISEYSALLPGYHVWMHPLAVLDFLQTFWRDEITSSTKSRYFHGRLHSLHRALKLHSH